MLKATVYDGPQELRLEQEVPEPGAVNGHVGTLHLLLPNRGGVLWCSLRLLILLVVQQLIICIILSHTGHRNNREEKNSSKVHTLYSAS